MHSPKSVNVGSSEDEEASTSHLLADMSLSQSTRSKTNCSNFVGNSQSPLMSLHSPRVDSAAIDNLLDSVLGNRFFRPHTPCTLPPVSRDLSTPMVEIYATSYGKRLNLFQEENAINETIQRMMSTDAVEGSLNGNREAGQIRIEEQETILEPSLLTLPTSHRKPSLFEQLLYNMRQFESLQPQQSLWYKSIVSAFEFSWTPVKSLLYFVQDHHSKCRNMVAWPAEDDLKSSWETRFSRKCRCPFERAVSYVVIPFYFQVFRPNHSIASMLEGSFHHPLADFMPDEAIVLKSHSSSAELSFDQASQNQCHNPITRQRKRHSTRSPSVFSSTSGHVTIRAHRHRSRGSEKDNIVSQVSSTSFQAHPRILSWPPEDTRSLPLTCQYARPLTNGLWIRSRMCEKKCDQIDILMFFAGKDMFATGWLPFLSEWFKAEVRHAAQTYAKSKSSKRQTASVTQPIGLDSKTPKNIPRWDMVTFKGKKQHHRLKRPDSRSERNKVLRSESRVSKKSADSDIKDRTVAALQESSPDLENDLRVVSNLTCRVNATFLLVEYPGYGHSQGIASPSSCVDSGIEALRNIVKELEPKSAIVHVLGYSLGSAIALRFANMIVEQVIFNHEISASSIKPFTRKTVGRKLWRFGEPLTKVALLKNLVLIAPFSSTWDCANSILGIPKGLQHISRFLFDVVSNKKIQYDSKAAIGRLGYLLKERLTVSLMFGQEDKIVPSTMAIALATHLRDIVGRQSLHEAGIKVNCIRALGADHSSILDPTRLLQVLEKHHKLPALCTIEPNSSWHAYKAFHVPHSKSDF